MSNKMKIMTTEELEAIALFEEEHEVTKCLPAIAVGSEPSTLYKKEMREVRAKFRREANVK